MEAVCELSICPVAARRAVPELSSCPVTATEAAYELLSCSELAKEAISEFSSCAEPAMVSGFELSVLPVSVKESEFELFVGPDLIIVSDVEPYVCPISIYEFVFCPTSPVTTPETFPELPVGSSSLVTAQKPAFELLTLHVMNSETINALYVCPVTPVIAKETINELSTYPVSVKKSNFEPNVCPVSTNEPDYELFARSVVIREITDKLVFPALALGAINTLSVSCVSVSLDPSAPPVPSAPPWWSSVWLVVVCSALVGSSSVCSAPVGSSYVCSALVGSSSVCSALVGFSSVLASGSTLAPSSVGFTLVFCSALVLCPASSASVPSLSTSTWTWPSVPPPVPPPLHHPPGLY